jgi:hypothetical protein
MAHCRRRRRVVVKCKSGTEDGALKMREKNLNVSRSAASRPKSESRHIVPKLQKRAVAWQRKK